MHATLEEWIIEDYRYEYCIKQSPYKVTKVTVPRSRIRGRDLSPIRLTSKVKRLQICTPLQVNRFFLVRYYGTAWYPRLFQKLLEPYSALLLVLDRQMDF